MPEDRSLGAARGLCDLLRRDMRNAAILNQLAGRGNDLGSRARLRGVHNTHGSECSLIPSRRAQHQTSSREVATQVGQNYLVLGRSAPAADRTDGLTMTRLTNSLWAPYGNKSNA